MAILGATAFWLTLLGGLVAMVLLSGCSVLEESLGDQGNFRVTVECEEKSTVDVQLDLDRQQQQTERKTEGIPAVPTP